MSRIYRIGSYQWRDTKHTLRTLEKAILAGYPKGSKLWLNNSGVVVNMPSGDRRHYHRHNKLGVAYIEPHPAMLA